MHLTTNDPEIQKHPELVNKEQDKVGTPKILYLTKVVHQQQRFNLFSILNVGPGNFERIAFDSIQHWTTWSPQRKYSHTGRFSKIFAVKKRMGKKTRLTTLKLYCPLPTETSKHQLPPSESNEVKKRKRIVKPKQLQGVIVCVCVCQFRK